MLPCSDFEVQDPYGIGTSCCDSSSGTNCPISRLWKCICNVQRLTRTENIPTGVRQRSPDDAFTQTVPGRPAHRGAIMHFFQKNLFVDRQRVLGRVTDLRVSQRAAAEASNDVCHHCYERAVQP